jgi:hypothetical protein
MIEVKSSPKPTGSFWWFRNGDNWHAPEYNNGEIYLPNVRQKWLRDFYWFCRNPIGNFMGFVIGVEGYDYKVYGPYGLLTTRYDETPHGYGWCWTFIHVGWFWLPFVSYSGKRFLWYIGWRPASGGFGIKFNIHGR